MATTEFDGPLYVSGSTAALRVPPFGSPVPDPNPDSGPSIFFQGVAMLDPRIWFPKDKVVGYTGVVQAHMRSPAMVSVDQIPATVQTANIAALQHAVNGTAMTLAAAATGIALNVPIWPFSGVLNGANGGPVIAPIALDFGFRFANCTAGSPTIGITDTTNFRVGDPLVIAGVGSADGTQCLLTYVLTIPNATSITVPATAAPVATNSAAPIGTGDRWQNPGLGTQPLPLAAFPFFARGPGLFLDPRQAITRAVSVTGVSGGAGGAVLVSGWDIYGQPMTQTITVAAGVNTVYSTKCFKYIGSAVPQFGDAHNYSVGTSDVFGFNYRSTRWEESNVCWAGALMTSNTGWTGADNTNPATSATGDVRGVIQTGAGGGGTGIGTTASNGTVVAGVMSGNRLMIANRIEMIDMILSAPTNAAGTFGQTQA